MEDSKDYFVANIVTKEGMQYNGYIDFLLRNMKEQISNGILDIVSDGNEYVIKMLPEQRIEKTDMLSVEIRQGISVKELVRCEKCKHHEVFKNRVNGWCNKHERPTDVTYFCADGERRKEKR